jgi:hypothetical protein
MNNAMWAAIVTLATLVGALGGSWIERMGHERELDIKMVEIAVGVLNAKPKADLKSVRDWALKVINHYSEVKLPDEARRELESQPLPRPVGVGPIGGPSAIGGPTGGLGPTGGP